MGTEECVRRYERGIEARRRQRRYQIGVVRGNIQRERSEIESEIARDGDRCGVVAERSIFGGMPQGAIRRAVAGPGVRCGLRSFAGVTSVGATRRAARHSDRVVCDVPTGRSVAEESAQQVGREFARGLSEQGRKRKTRNQRDVDHSLNLLKIILSHRSAEVNRDRRLCGSRKGVPEFCGRISRQEASAAVVASIGRHRSGRLPPGVFTPGY